MWDPCLVNMLHSVFRLAFCLSTRGMARSTRTIVKPNKHNNRRCCSLLWLYVPLICNGLLSHRFDGASDDSLQTAIRDALDVPVDWRVVLRDLDDSSVIAVTSSLPSGLRCSAEVKAPTTNFSQNSSESEHDEFGESTRDRAPNSAATRATLLKFERINAHLANERTWLSWVRTTLATMTCGFSFLSLTSYNDTWGTAVFVLGSLFIGCAAITYITGRLRFQRLKRILSLEYSMLVPRFKRFGMAHHAVFFALLVLATSVAYWAGVIEVY